MASSDAERGRRREAVQQPGALHYLAKSLREHARAFQDGPDLQPVYLLALIGVDTQSNAEIEMYKDPRGIRRQPEYRRALRRARTRRDHHGSPSTVVRSSAAMPTGGVNTSEVVNEEHTR